jgi:hypothetical protein
MEVANRLWLSCAIYRLVDCRNTQVNAFEMHCFVIHDKFFLFLYSAQGTMAEFSLVWLTDMKSEPSGITGSNPANVWLSFCYP